MPNKSFYFEFILKIMYLLGDTDVGDRFLMLVEVSRQDHFTLGCDVGDLSAKTCHQHIWSHTSITNIVVIINFEINKFNILVYF